MRLLQLRKKQSRPKKFMRREEYFFHQRQVCTCLFDVVKEILISSTLQRSDSSELEDLNILAKYEHLQLKG
jgi:hypothetical protein